MIRERKDVERLPSGVSHGIETLLKEHEVAGITQVSIATLRRWRLLQQGPKFLKLGAAVRYRENDLLAWLESRPIGGDDLTRFKVTL
jgi:predicted DNA-binding transcriptional regulator AlpA